MPVLVLGAASLAFAGVCTALVVGYSKGTVEAPTSASPVVVSRPSASDPDCGPTDTVRGGFDATEAQSADPCEVGREVEEDDGTDIPDETTPGAAVSEAARACPPGPEHGSCVSAVAHSHAGKPDPSATDEVVDAARDDSAADDGSTGSTDTTAGNPAKAHGAGKVNGKDKRPADPGSQGNRSETAASHRR